MTDPQISRRAGVTRRLLLIGGTGLVAVAAGATGYFAPWSGGTSGRVQAEPAERDLLAEGPLPENFMGEATAPNTVIEYSSMTCPHCARFHKDVVPDLKSKYIDTGKVRYILREFPLDNLAFAASMLARCAAPEKFFPFVEALYAKQGDWAFGEGDPVPRLFKMAQQAGFTKQTFEACLRDQKLLDSITEVRKRAQEKFGVTSTPTLFVNGKLLKGARSIEDIEKLMDLGEKKS